MWWINVAICWFFASLFAGGTVYDLLTGETPFRCSLDMCTWSEKKWIKATIRRQDNWVYPELEEVEICLED